MATTEQLRVLYVCHADFRAPAEKQVLCYAHELLRHGHEVMISVAGDPSTALDEPGGDDPRLVLRGRRFRGRELSRDDLEAGRRFNPTLIHAFNASVSVVAAARSWSRATGAPVFAHFDEDYWSLVRGGRNASLIRRAARLGRRLASRLHPPAWHWPLPSSLRWVGRHACALDAITPVLARLVEERLGRPCAVLLPPAPLDLLARPGGSSRLAAEFDGHATVVYTGTVSDLLLHDLEVALHAVARLQREGRSVRFVQTGPVLPRLDLEALAAAAGLEPGTAAWLRYQPFETVVEVLHRATVLVQPGHASFLNLYRLPAKLPTYLASGTPTITFASGAGELLEDRVEVLKTYSDAPEELADRIRDVLDDAGLRERLARNGPLAARRLFDPGRAAEALLTHYRAGLARAERP